MRMVQWALIALGKGVSLNVLWVLVVGLSVGPLLSVHFYSSQSRAYEAERILRELKAIVPWVPRSLTGLFSCHLSDSSYVCYIKGPAFSAILSRKNRRKYNYSVFPESNFHLKINLWCYFKRKRTSYWELWVSCQFFLRSWRWCACWALVIFYS